MLRLYFTYLWDRPQPTDSNHFGTSRKLAGVIKRAIFHFDRLRVSAGQVPENRIFPWESVVVLNTVLSAAALARDKVYDNKNFAVLSHIVRAVLAPKQRL